MLRRKRWTIGPTEDGVVEIELFSWAYFGDFIYQRLLDYTTYIFRGQRRSDWSLESTLDRELRPSPAGARPGKLKAHLEAFQYAVRGRRGPNPSAIKDENDWWALGQHHGLSTPLLDWTASPYVAAFFAFENTKPDDTRRRVVFALSRNTLQKKSGGIAKAFKGPGRPPIVEFHRPLSDDNARLVNQAGLFTRAPIGVDVESWIKERFAGEKHWLLIKLTIPGGDRAQCLKELNRMNINYLTLFPDLYGASRHCNTTIRIPRY
jgi:hypothetical protein